MKKFILLTIFIMSSFSLVRAQILPELEKIKEIKIAESNQEDVRRILGNFKYSYNEDKLQDIFYTDNSEISISYSKGLCSEDSEAWELNIQKWKVEGISIEPKIPLELKDIGFSPKRYKKEKIYRNVADEFIYHDKDSGIVIKVQNKKVEGIFFNPPKKYYSLLCDKEQSKILSSTNSLFTKKLKLRESIIDTPNYIRKLKLSSSEVFANCFGNVARTKSCSNSSKEIKVSTVATGPKDELTFSYTVTGGKIIGYGSKVIWDLSGAKPGIYTITTAVDDGCGFCGKSMTKTVVVKECLNCKKGEK